ncbi:hypothetical protein CDL12_14834 [Handroanthus impetiginosus]|uniref:mRNA-associated protein RAP55 n=1 Tax=Handroanthus impetiginosus TaxID=429701 RepID=A0A2G9H4W2_9LAMI|nr:hypothetical protein CDL12_14834 [Handroanthus impetiginosus]
MAEEPSSITNRATPSSSSVADSYIGSFISVTSKSEIRYEGVLYCLNPQDSTLGLKNVRSYGTEGRKKDGPQVPPSDKIYEYILFRGSDIKDLEVKSGPPAKIEESIYNDPAIIQSIHYGKPASAVNGPSTDFNLCSETSAVNTRSQPSILPLHHSGNQLGQWGSSQSRHNTVSSYDMPTQWQGYSGAPRGIPAAHQHSSSSATTLYPLQDQESTNMAVTNLLNNFSPGHPSAASNSIYLNAIPIVTSEQLSTPFSDSISSKLSLPFQHSTLLNSNGLAMPFPFIYQNTSSIEASAANNVVPDHVMLSHVQPSPHSASSSTHPISETLLSQQPPLLTPNQLSQPRLSEHPSEKNLYLDQKIVNDMGAISLELSSSAAIPGIQPPLLPLPPPTEKLQYTSEFDEEFDFQAMNEKFKKDEVWGYLGKTSQRDKKEMTLENGKSSHYTGNDNNRLVTNHELKPAYNKDDFFDTISCNSVGRGSRSGQNRFSNRMKMDYETFGNFQQRTQSGYDGPGARRGDHHGPYNWGRAYDYGYRGRGGFRLR